MSSLKNKLSFKTFGLVYPFEYDFKWPRVTVCRIHYVKWDHFTK